MLRGLYESAQGMISRLTLQDVSANNLANINSTGFQREVAAIHTRRLPPRNGGEDARDPRTAPLAADPLVVKDTRPGVLQQTGNPHDVALNGAGYFVVGGAKELRLLRSGSLQLNGNGEIALATGQPLLGADGNAIRPGGPDWKITPDGVVVDGANRPLGRLRVMDSKNGVTPVGDSLVTAPAASLFDIPAAQVSVRGGYLEGSNVSPMEEMVDMIAGMRAYEAGQKSIQSQDETLQNLFSLLK